MLPRDPGRESAPVNSSEFSFPSTVGSRGAQERAFTVLNRQIVTIVLYFNLSVSIKIN